MRNPVNQAIFALVAFIGFAAYAMHAVNSYNTRARVMEPILACEYFREQVNAFVAKNGKLPVRMNELEQQQPQSKYMKSIDLLADATIVVTLQGDEEAEGKMILWRPALEAGKVTWVCGTPDEDFFKYLPGMCRHKLQPAN